MTFAMPGVFSTIDTTSLVQAELAAMAKPLNNLASRKASYEAKKNAVSDIEERMRQLYNAVGSLDDATALRKVTASVADKDVVTVSTADGATEGSHTIEVNQLAKAERRVHSGVAELTTLVGIGTFSYNYDGVDRSIATTAETTLENLMELINNDADNPGVTASVLEYDAGASEKFHLVLSGNDSGGDYTITINATTDLASFSDDESSFFTTQDAANSQVKIDGYPAGESDWIERSSNTIADLVPGLTVTLQGVGDTSIGMSQSTSNLKGSLTNLVSVYNGIASALDTYTGYDEATGQSGTLQGDATVNGLLTEIRSLMTGSVDGFIDGQDSFSLMADLGFDIDREGKMTLDEDILSDALEEDYYAVLDLVGAISAGASNSEQFQFNGAMASTVPGVYEVKASFDGAGVVTAAWIRTKGETEWRDADLSGSEITGKTTFAEEYLRITAIWDGVSAEQTAEVRVQKGFAGNLYDKLDGVLDATDGTFALKIGQYDDAVEGIDREIELMESRLKDKEEILRAKYARMEVALSQLDGMRGAYDAMFQSLAANQG